MKRIYLLIALLCASTAHAQTPIAGRPVAGPTVRAVVPAVWQDGYGWLVTDCETEEACDTGGGTFKKLLIYSVDEPGWVIASGSVPILSHGSLSDLDVPADHAWAMRRDIAYSREPCAFTNPVTGHSGFCGWHFTQAVTLTRVWCFTRGGGTETVTIQLDERTEAGIASAGTDVMTATLVCDNDGQATTGFDNAGIAANSFVNLDIDAVANAPTGVYIVPIFITN